MGRSYESTGREVLPEGEYVLEIKDLEEGESSKGKQLVKLVFRVAEGDHAGKEFWGFFPEWKMSVLAKALNCKRVVDEKNRAYYDWQVGDIVGQYIRTQVAPREYNSKTFNEVGQDMEAVDANSVGKETPF